jgi:predicted ATPase
MKSALKHFFFSESKEKSTLFKSLEINNWKQFAKINIEFHDRLTILTGANASGKTTILNALALHFGWQINELNAPRNTNSNGEWNYVDQIDDVNKTNLIGQLTYKNGSISLLQRPTENSPTYQLKFLSPKSVSGMYLPEHRPTFRYIPVDQSKITKASTIAQAFKTVLNLLKNLTSSHDKLPTNYYIKQTLLNCKELYDESNFSQEYQDYYIGFEVILRRVLPKTLGFERLEVRGSEVVCVTSNESWLIDSASGGIGALIDLIWQIFIIDKEANSNIAVLIDEIENHLHASMQRSILPDLVLTFPRVQFIIATHSPLIIGSVKESFVYTLRYNENMKVESLLLDLRNKAKSATEILNRILGVPFTMPIWVEEELKNITQEFSTSEFSEVTVKKLRERLSVLGLEDLIPEAIKDIIDGKANKRDGA